MSWSEKDQEEHRDLLKQRVQEVLHIGRLNRDIKFAEDVIGKIDDRIAALRTRRSIHRQVTREAAGA